MAMDLAQEFERRKPWVTKFIINGTPYGGQHGVEHDPRLGYFEKFIPQRGRILELGSLEGGHSFALASMPGVNEVIAIEGRKASYRRALFVQEVLQNTNVKFLRENLERYDLRKLGHFDAVFCSGLLYHLPKPWRLLERIGQVTDNVFVWTHYTTPDKVRVERHGYQGFYYREWRFFYEALSGMSPRSFWPTKDSLFTMLADQGFKNVTVAEDEPSHRDGPALSLIASKNPA